MVEVRTLNLKLRLEPNLYGSDRGKGNYLIELMGESPFDVSKSFSEKIYTDKDQKPFTTVEDAAKFVNQTAVFWQGQIKEFPLLDITGVQELADIWEQFSTSINSFYSGLGDQTPSPKENYHN
ncbi:hypothetical protein [Adhaeribacter aquaticus]|uniref:hypothetical protein n=1 Tax=Adhaeribacter aquaticus TaxID=299567 RepID=UPI00047A5CF4|nr:hypothetical protein [Adhaeribacter aquaticus]